MIAYLKPNWKLLLIGTLCAIVTGLLGLGIVVLPQDGFSALQTKDVHLLVLVCVGVIALYALKGMFSFCQNVLYAEVSQRIGLRLRNDIYTHLQSLSLSYFDRQRTGNLISTVANDVPVLQTGITSVKDAVSGSVIAIAGSIYIFFMSWQLTLIVLFILPPMVYAIGRIARKLRTISLETQQKMADVTTLMEETLAGVRLVRSFVAEKREIARFGKETQAAKDVAMKGIRRTNALSPV
ncbi:MAG TPA: ABC transporter transmembrane domain-containing protein, partial [Capsulimonadaceae bacterium]|nr:ABC transporter transmembrane domain-containing protein [Capsulimonadaceae bacterium]